MRRPSSAKNSGFVLALTFVLIFVLSLAIASLLDGQTKTVQLLGRDVRTIKAHYLAESGVVHSLSIINAGGDGNIAPTALGIGQYKVETSVSTEASTMTITSESLVPLPPKGEIKKTVKAEASFVKDKGWVLTRWAE